MTMPQSEICKQTQSDSGANQSNVNFSGNKNKPLFSIAAHKCLREDRCYFLFKSQRIFRVEFKRFTLSLKGAHWDVIYEPTFGILTEN